MSTSETTSEPHESSSVSTELKNYDPDEGSDFSFVALFKQLVRRWPIVALTTLACCAGGLLYIKTATRIYQSQTIIELNVRRPRITSSRVFFESTGGSDGEDMEFNTQIQKFKSSQVAEIAMQALSELREGNMPTDEEIGETFEIIWMVIRNSRLIRIIVQHANPKLAAELATSYATAAVRSTFIANKQESDNAVAWLEEQANLQRKEVAEAERALLEFREANAMETFENELESVSKAVFKFNEELLRVETQASLIQDMVRQLAKLELDQDMAGELPSSIPRSQDVSSRLQALTAAKIEYENLLIRYTEKNPQVQAQQIVIDTARQQLLDAVGRAKATAESDLRLLQQQARSLHSKKVAQSKIASNLERRIVQLQTQLNALERDNEASIIAYRGVLNRIEEARLSADENTTFVEVVEPARVPGKPIKPKKSPSTLQRRTAGRPRGYLTDLHTR